MRMCVKNLSKSCRSTTRRAWVSHTLSERVCCERYPETLTRCNKAKLCSGEWRCRGCRSRAERIARSVSHSSDDEPRVRMHLIFVLQMANEPRTATSPSHGRTRGKRSRSPCEHAVLSCSIHHTSAKPTRTLDARLLSSAITRAQAQTLTQITLQERCYCN